MTTLFKAPQVGEPRSVGVKNGGVTSYSRRTVAPVTRIVGDAFIPGQQVTGDEIYVKYGNEEVTQTLFGLTHEKPPLTVLLATSIGATKFVVFKNSNGENSE